MDEPTNCASLDVEDAVEVELPQRGALDWHAMVGWLEARSVRGVEAVMGSRGDRGEEIFWRTVEVDGHAGAIGLRHGSFDLAHPGRAQPGRAHPEAMLLTISLQRREALEGLATQSVAARAQRMLAAGMEISDALAHLGSDPVLGPLVSSQPALRPPGCWDPFEATVRAVLAQQITVSGARTIAGRIAERLGAPVTGFDRLGLNRLFPGPDRLVEADLDGIGLTGSRVAALRGVAAAALDGFDFHGPGLARRLTELRGIGGWTAQYVALRTGEPDAFPSSDIGLRKAAGRLMGVERLSVREIEELSRRWSPWRSVAAIHLWWSLSAERSCNT